MLTKQSLSDFDKKLKSSRTLHHLNQTLVQYLLSFGIKTFAFTYYSYYANSMNKIKYDFTSDNFKSWHNHYRSENYDEIDSVLEKVIHTNMPTFWDAKQQLKNAKSSREKQMRLDSIAFGAVKGLSIPIHGPQEDFAILLLVQMRGENCLDSWQDLQYEFFAAAYYYYHYLQQELLKALKPIEKNKLNRREIQCLSLIAKQYPIEAIASDLHITERTVNYHIQRLNKKLGTRNKYLSVIKAIQQGLIIL